MTRLRRLMAGPGPKRAYDPLTGQFLSEEWLEERNAQIKTEQDDWRHQDGNCMTCSLPLRLHPPARLINAEPALCILAALEANRGADYYLEVISE